MTEEIAEFVPVTVKMPLELRLRLDQMAAAQGGRSLASLIRQILEEELEKSENDEPEATE